MQRDRHRVCKGCNESWLKNFSGKRVGKVSYRIVQPKVMKCNMLAANKKLTSGITGLSPPWKYSTGR